MAPAGGSGRSYSRVKSPGVSTPRQSENTGKRGLSPKTTVSMSPLDKMSNPGPTSRSIVVGGPLLVPSISRTSEYHKDPPSECSRVCSAATVLSPALISPCKGPHSFNEPVAETSPLALFNSSAISQRNGTPLSCDFVQEQTAATTKSIATSVATNASSRAAPPRKGTAISYDFVPEYTAASVYSRATSMAKRALSQTTSRQKRTALSSDVHQEITVSAATSSGATSVAINAAPPVPSWLTGAASNYTYASHESFVVDGPITHPGLSIGKPKLPACSELELAQELPVPTALQRIGVAISEAGDIYTRKLAARCPCCCVLLGLLLVLTIIGIGFLTVSIDIETDFSSFLKTDAAVSIKRDAYLAALQDRIVDASRRLQVSQLLRPYNIYVLYELKEGVGSLSEVLWQINVFENSLRELSGWVSNCNQVEKVQETLCRPGISLPAHAFPENIVKDKQIVPEEIALNGKGKVPISWKAIMKQIVMGDFAKFIFPKNFNASVSEPSSRFIRSAFQFKFTGPMSTDSTSRRHEIHDRLGKDWNMMVKQVITLVQAENERNDMPFNVYFEGEDVSQIEIIQALNGDLQLAIASLCFVCFYVLCHTGSILLSLGGLFIVGLAIPFAFVIYAWIAGSGRLSIASFLSMFLVIGFGTDDLFVFTDGWRHSKGAFSHNASLSDRLRWTLFHAGKASLATSVTTALSFFANLASVLKPLREFGVFMGLCVVCVWLLTFLLYAPLCLVDEYWLSSCRLHCPCRRDKRPSQTSFLGAWIRNLHPMRRYVVGFSVFTVVVIIFPAIWCAKVDTGLPEVFPNDHNQVRGQELFEEFAPLDRVLDVAYSAPDLTLDVCDESNFELQSCPVFWCETPTEGYFARFNEVPPGTCQCWRKRLLPYMCPSDASFASVKTRVVGPAALSASQLSGPLADAMISKLENEYQPLGLKFQSSSPARISELQVSQLPEIVIENWVSGGVMHAHVHEIASVLRRSEQTSVCGVEQLCFCGTYTCKPKTLLGWGIGPNFTLGDRRLNRNLAAAQIAPKSQVSVDVAFGLEVTQESVVLGQIDAKDMWSFRDTFDMSNVWTQRNLLKFCTNFPKEIRVLGGNMKCWIKTFRDFVLYRRGRFPVPADEFKSTLAEFRAVGWLTGDRISADFLWMRGQTVKASFMVFDVDVSKHVDTEEATRYEKLWDKYVTEWNLHSSQYAYGAFHSSNLWVRIEAQRELVSSTLVTFTIVVILAFIGMLVFTLDAALSLLVVTCTVCVVIGLLFFIVIMMGWAIGPIEVIALIVFIGYAVTYTLHIAHKYASSQCFSNGAESLAESFPANWPLNPDKNMLIRYRRTGYAAKSIGGAALGSALTTVGCAIFLLGCTLTFFRKLGGVVLVVTLLSIFTALVPLPALLLMIGPLKPGKNCFRCMDFMTVRRSSEGLKRINSLGGASPRTGLQIPSRTPTATFNDRDETIMITITDDFADHCRSRS